LVKKIKQKKPKLTIALVGKYTTMLDTYASVVEALKAACWQSGNNLNLRWVDSEEIEKDGTKSLLSDVAGIVVPGGFGSRGIEGKIKAIQYARENKVPYLGLCLGMQLAVVEFARNVAGIKQATSAELINEEATSRDSHADCVIDLMDDQKNVTNKGGTMRLGGWDCVLAKDSFAYAAYGKEKIRERHRHRYEFNNSFKEQLEKAGLRIAGTTPDSKLVEIVEVPDHPWFVGVQYHAEFTSRPISGHPLFNSFIAAAIKSKRQ
jgi:CTP synthase